jgi:hypothetical protein
VTPTSPSRRATAFRAAAGFLVLFLVVIAWAYVWTPAHVGGNVMCVSTAETARAVVGEERPGLYTFNLETGAPVPLPPSMATRQLIKSVFKPAYEGAVGCALMALRRSVGGVIALTLVAGSLLGLVASLVVGLSARRRT